MRMIIAVKQKGEMMDELISRREAIKVVRDSCHWDYHWASKSPNDIMSDAVNALKELPSAQPERTKRIIGKSINGMTMWYQCESCNEPVDEKDLFCSGCGRRFEDG